MERMRLKQVRASIYLSSICFPSHSYGGLIDEKTKRCHAKRQEPCGKTNNELSKDEHTK